jgi:hypothetical protein
MSVSGRDVDRLGNGVGDAAARNTNMATVLKNAAQSTATRGREHPRRYQGRDRVRRVVETVDDIEGERDRRIPAMSQT